MREVRISCSDATGLGCDVTRLLLDFGLRIISGEISHQNRSTAVPLCALLAALSYLLCYLKHGACGKLVGMLECW